MATEIALSRIADWRRLGASGGVALTTTSQVINFIEGQQALAVRTRNFSASGIFAQLALCPYGLIFKTSDLLATAGNITEYSDEAQDGDAATDVVLSSIDTIANLDALYVGSDRKFRGADIDVDAANGDASVLTVKYWNGSAWTDITDTDGTASGGASMAVDGQVTWNVPAAWAASDLLTIGDATKGVASELVRREAYWTRWEWSVALDASATLNHLILLNQNANYIELLEGEPLEQAMKLGWHGESAVEALMSAGTGNLLARAGARDQFPV